MHFDAPVAAKRLTRILELADGLSATYAALGDERSQRALIDVLKLRVLGPFHAPLRVTPEQFRAHQTHVDRTMRLQAGTFQTTDPFFSGLSLYRIPFADRKLTMHGHSVDLVSVFVLSQYGYQHGGADQVVAGPGDVVLDVGACWGDTALYFASLVGPEGKVYAFEPDAGNAAILQRNLELNPELAERIELVPMVLWERSGETLRFASQGRNTTVIGDGAQPTSEVSTITLDDFVDRYGLQRLDFIKMDVEGAEASVLRGGDRALQRFSPRFAIAAYHRDDDLVELPRMLEAAGRSYRLYLDSFSPVEAETVLFGAPG